jgi:cytochrome c-type biogenesis protein CcmH/NrfF
MLALAVLIGGHHIGWGLAVLPVWVLLISVFILVDIRRRQEANVKTLDNICW